MEKIRLIFFLNNFFFNNKKKANIPITKIIELWTRLCAKTKFVKYERIVNNKIPLIPISPKESLTERILEEIYPYPIIENKIVR